MEMLLSNRPIVQSLPDSYVLPPDRRPGIVNVPIGNDIPVIGFQTIAHPDDRVEIVQQILKACQEFGLFQVINHGVSGTLMDEAMSVLNEFFCTTPAEYEARFVTDACDKSCILFTSDLKNIDNEDGVHYWRDCFIHHCNPLEEHIKNWPENPTRYQ
ncbi:hypothetical protein ACSBR1_008980 [Camellia fascicularis]